VVSGTSWNTNGDIVCAPANLTAAEITEVVNRVTEDYRPFNVTITTNDSAYAAADPLKRMRVIITESWQWYGQQVGGVSFINSFTWGDNTPCFVFSLLLGYNIKKIAESASHEAGHTLGLRHQSVYDASCNKTNEYNYGQGEGETGWAPIMGCSYAENLSTWHNGPNSIGCSVLQDDINIIAGVVGFKTDDYSNTISGAAPFSQAIDGVVSKNDIDFFATSLSAASTLTVNPYSIGNNQGADLDILLKVYNQSGNLVATVNDPAGLSASVSLNAGQYFISVEPTGNIYANIYGIMGKYSLSVTAN
jgi:hypothetical protein